MPAMNEDMRNVLSAILRGDNQGATGILASIDDNQRGLALVLELSVFSAAMMAATFGAENAAKMLENCEIRRVTSQPDTTPQQPPADPPPMGQYL